jgi:hypothetical protein
LFINTTEAVSLIQKKRAREKSEERGRKMIKRGRGKGEEQGE